MSKVTKLLGLVAGVLICIELAGPMLHSLFFRELGIQKQTLAKVSRQLRLKELAARQATAITRKFQERIKLNFESDLAKARLTYQEYLLRLTEACALGSVMISSSQPERLEELGHVLHFSVQAIGTTEQIGRLIDGFYQTEALHRISHLNIFQSLGPDSPTHSLTLDVAVLVLESDTDSKGNLASPAGHLLKDLFASQDIFRRRASGVITQPELNLESGVSMLSGFFNNLSVPPVDPPMANPPQPEMPSSVSALPQPPVIDPKSNVRLVGIISKGSKKYAMFCDTTRDVQYTVDEQSNLDELGIKARITCIQSAEVQLVEDNRSLELPLGKLLSEATAQ